MQDQSSTCSFLSMLQPPTSLCLVLLSPHISSVWVQCTQGMLNSFFFGYTESLLQRGCLGSAVAATRLNYLHSLQDLSSLTGDWTSVPWLEGRFSTTGPPGKSLCGHFFGYLFPLCLCHFSRIDFGNQSWFWKLAASVSWTFWQE